MVPCQQIPREKSTALGISLQGSVRVGHGVQDFFEFALDAVKPPATKKPWMDSKVMKVITLEEDLVKVVDDCIASGRYGLDTETTGLDSRVFDGRTRDQIVGICLAPDVNHGYYIPLRHKRGKNLSISVVSREMERLTSSESIAVFHNGKFDQQFLQFNGGAPWGEWDDPKRWEDTLILAWLENTRRSSLGLKELSKTLLGQEMIEINELFPTDYKGPVDFSELDPDEEFVGWYACADALCTLQLYYHLAPRVLEPDGDKSRGQGSVYTLEKMCLPSTRWMERCRVFIDKEKVNELLELANVEFHECLLDIYDWCNSAVGSARPDGHIEPGWVKLFREINPRDVTVSILDQLENCRKMAEVQKLDEPFQDAKGKYRVLSQMGRKISGKSVTFESKMRYDVLSNAQIGGLLVELNIPGLTLTGSGMVSTTADTIDELVENHGEQYPFLSKISRLRSLQKAVSTYLVSLRDHTGPDDTLAVNYKQWGTDTGRFTTPSSKDPSLDGGTKYPLHGTPATYDKSKPVCLTRVREAVKARPGKIMAAIDYSGVELRIATALSGEPKWLREYFRCSDCGLEFDQGDGESTPSPPPPLCPRCGSDKIGDLHTLTAMVFYGQNAPNEPGWKLKRQNAKSANFALAYGGSKMAVMRATGCDENEASKNYENFINTYNVLTGWWEQVKNFGRKYGYVQTAFGRHYPVPDIRAKEDDPEKIDAAARIVAKQQGVSLDEITISEADLEHYRKRTGDEPHGITRYRTAYQDTLLKIARSVARKDRAKAERNATNGPIQGFSADITKLAMALIFREIKKRNWFDKVYMVITIHDELVFEIDKDIFAEAIALFKEVMTRSKPILGIKWKVPLTTDVEFGWNWTVPYNLIDFMYGRVCDDGRVVDDKGKPTGKSWDPEIVQALQSWKDRKFLPPVLDDEGNVVTPRRLPDGTEVPTASSSPAVLPSVSRAMADDERVEIATYQISRMAFSLIEPLANIISQCDGKGTTKIRILSDNGEVISDGEYTVALREWDRLLHAFRMPLHRA